MKTIKSDEGKITFLIETSETIANAIRRYVSHIPILAIDEIEISKNGSALYDETIAHRMGLIPLEMEKKFEKNSPVLNLKSKKGGIVYSKEIDGDAKIVFGEIPITSLNEGQELELIAKTKMGLGIEHSKFNPGFIYYRNVSEISVDKKVGEEIKKIFPNVELKERGEKVILLDSEEKDLGDLCESLSEKDKKDFERKFKEELILTIESFGQLPVKEIFSRSIEHLKKDLESVTKKISKQ